MSDTRQHAHELIDRMPETQLSALVGLLKAIVPEFEDEEIGEDEEQTVARSIEWFKHNKGIPFEDVVSELGLPWIRSANIRNLLEENRLFRRCEERHSSHLATDGNERLAATHRLVEIGPGDIKVLHGNETAKRLRVGDYRVRFLETKDEIRVNAVKNRKDAYR